MTREYKGVLIYSYEGDEKTLVFSLPGENEDRNVKITGTAFQTAVSEKALAESRIVKLMIYPKREIRIKTVQLILPKVISEKSYFFSNGYQSWTESREYSPGEKQKPMRRILSYWIKKYRLEYLGDEYFSRRFYKNYEAFSYTYTYLREPGSDRIHFFGSLSEEDAFTLFARCEPKEGNNKVFRTTREEKGKRSLIIERDCSGFSVSKPWCSLLFLELSSDKQSAFNIYARQWAINNATPLRTSYFGKKNCITGWTSWYNYFGKVTERDVLKVLKFYSENSIPLDLFQIDDGWQTAVGDWL